MQINGRLVKHRPGLDGPGVWVLETFLALRGILYLRENSLVISVEGRRLFSKWKGYMREW